MRTALFAAAIAGALAFVTPAAAQDYPWCRLGNHDCMYQTYGQCMAALSGTFGDCRQNPVLLAAPQQARPLSAYDTMPRHHRHHHHGRHRGHRHHHRG